MANRYRGEIDVELDGRAWRMALTLGVLAELEDRFRVASLGELVARLASGNLASAELAAVLAAGLRGGGQEVTEQEVARMQSPDGTAGYLKIVTRLLGATFGDIMESGGRGQ
jgi:hypothetical protein